MSEARHRDRLAYPRRVWQERGRLEGGIAKTWSHVRAGSVREGIMPDTGSPGQGLMPETGLPTQGLMTDTGSQRHGGIAPALSRNRADTSGQ